MFAERKKINGWVKRRKHKTLKFLHLKIMSTLVKEAQLLKW